MIAVIDYEMGNLRSVGNALDRLGAEWKLTADHDEIRRASKVLLPGVGNDAEAMARLRDRDLCQLIRDYFNHYCRGSGYVVKQMCDKFCKRASYYIFIIARGSSQEFFRPHPRSFRDGTGCRRNSHISALR